MTQEDKRIKLAEAAGWEVIELTLCNVKPDKNGDPEIEPIAPLPDYFNDLNAVHLLELKVFQDSSIQLDYSLSLIRLIKNSSPLGKRFFSDFDLITATAAQRCEALGLTLGLWEAAK